jgi:hypothetical protein
MLLKVKDFNDIVDNSTILGEDIEQILFIGDCSEHTQVEVTIEILDKHRFISHFGKFPYPIFKEKKFIKLLKEGEFDNHEFYRTHTYNQEGELIDHIPLTDYNELHSFLMGFIPPINKHTFTNS